MSERAVELKAGFSVADAEKPSLSSDNEVLRVSFVDWRACTVTLRFDKFCAVRWHRLFDAGPHERDDSAYEIVGSAWVEAHRSAGEILETETVHHYRLCFNACGQLDVIAGGVVVEGAA